MDTTSATPQPGWCLRFLSGAVKGRIIALHPGQNVIGSGSDCDVMLPSSDVLPRHLIVNVGDLVVTVQRVGTATATFNDGEMEQRRRSVAVGDVVAVGQITFQFDRSYPAAARDESPFDWPDTMFAKNAPEMTVEETPEPPRVRWVAAGCLFAAAIAVVVWAGFFRGPAGPSPASEVNAEAVNRAVVGYPELEVVTLIDGKLAVRGFVESKARKQALLEALKPFGSRVDINVQPADEIVAQAHRYLGSPAIAVNYTGRGQVVLSGTSDDEQLPRRVKQLAEDLHPTVLVVDRVDYRPKDPSKTRSAVSDREKWAAWQSQLPARLVSITDDGNGGRYIQLANGSRYYEGAVLRSGVEVQQIDADEGLSFSSPTPVQESEK